MIKTIHLRQLPPELILLICHHYLDGFSLRSLKNTCGWLYNLLSDHSSWTMTPRSLKDVTVKSGFQIHFHQTGSHLLDYVYNHQVVVHSPQGSTLIKYMGFRLSGDRCCYSRLPLNACMNGSDSDSVSVYFEVTVVQACPEKGHYMRIGLVHGNADHFHPPGSDSLGFGYQSSDGFISLSHLDGDKFQFAPVWKTGDTVGCGYARDLSGTYVSYFTLNGHWVGEAPPDICGTVLNYRGLWHAAVSSSGPCILNVNLGKTPFKFGFKSGTIPEYLQHRRPLQYSFRLEKSLGAMIPNVLPECSDPYLAPQVTPESITFPDNGLGVARSVISEAPLSFTSLGYGQDNRHSFYFEVSILEEGQGLNSFMSIGLSVKPFSPFHQVGWDRFSIGYHSDDGKLYFQTHQNGTVYGPTFTTGATIGCGFEPHQGLVYFTLNGALLGIAARGFYGNFHACVAAIRAWRVRVNLGADPFVFEFANGQGPLHVE